MKITYKTVIGLDIGRESLKVAEVREGFRDFELINYYDEPYLKNEMGITNISETIKTLFLEKKISGKKIVASFPSSSVTFRILQFPFHDRKKIDSIIKYEVEGLIPFSIDDIVVDYIVIGKKEKMTCVLSVIAEKKSLKEQIDLLAEAGLDPEIVDIDLFGLINSALFKFDNFSENLMILDLGSNETLVAVIGEGHLRMVKTISYGIKNSFEEVMSELKRVLKSLCKDEIWPIDLIYHCGEISNRSVGERIAGELNIETTLWNPVEVFKLKKKNLLPDSEYKAAVAFGLALRGINRSQDTLNLRKEDFHKKNIFEGLGWYLKIIVMLTSILLVLTVTNFSYKKIAAEKRFKYLKAEGENIFRKTFPKAHNVVNEVAQFKEKIRELKHEYQVIGGLSGETPIKFLRDIAVNMPSEKDLQIFSYSYEESEIRVEGKTATFEAVDNIKRALSKLSEIKNIKVTDTKLSSDQKSINFKMVLFMERMQ